MSARALIGSQVAVIANKRITTQEMSRLIANPAITLVRLATQILHVLPVARVAIELW